MKKLKHKSTDINEIDISQYIINRLTLRDLLFTFFRFS